MFLLVKQVLVLAKMAEAENWIILNITLHGASCCLATDEETQGATAAPTRRKGRISKQSAEQEKIGVTYPADLWYILADYIYPESVGRFGVLCKDAYATTKKRAFWRSLYNRFVT